MVEQGDVKGWGNVAKGDVEEVEERRWRVDKNMLHSPNRNYFFSWKAFLTKVW